MRRASLLPSVLVLHQGVAGREVPGQAYDYIKRPVTPAARAAIDSGWHLTFSLDEREQSLRRSRAWAAAGVNTAIVVGGPPGTTRKTHTAVAAALVARGVFAGRPALPGDEHDLRFLDPAVGGWVVLAAKGHKIKHDATGFVVRFDPEVLLGTDLPAERALWRTKDLERFTPTTRAIAAK